MRCHKTCKYCENSYSCLSCNDSYYFKNEEIMKNICYTGHLDYYYLSTHENISGFHETIDNVYKKCYQTCKTCLGEGNTEIQQYQNLRAPRPESYGLF